MAMLAEPKRKQKWTLNPRGKNWSDDQNKFGQKMLEKMGWTSGKGLGAQEQGMTDHIRVKYKEDQAGIGFNKDDYDKNWIENQSGFNDLLAQLQQNNEETSKTEVADLKGLSGKSLEMKSESSRARVHYKKFTRGKDVNKYNTKDLANIFGKKDLNEKYTSIHEVAEPEDNTQYDPIGTTENRNGVVTVKGGNMNDYFKNKLLTTSSFLSAKVKREKDDSESESERHVGFGFTPFGSLSEEPKSEYTSSNYMKNFVKVEKDDNDKTLKSEESAVVPEDLSSKDIAKNVNSTEIGSANETKVSKKKKNRRSNCTDTLNVIKEEEELEEKINFEEEKIKTPKSKHKSKRENEDKKKSAESEDVPGEESEAKAAFAFDNPGLMDVDAIDNGITPSSKKKKKNRKKDKDSENNTSYLEETIEEKPADISDLTEETPKKKKKKKRKNMNENESELNECQSLDTSASEKADKSNFAFENAGLISVNEIDAEESPNSTINNEYEVANTECSSAKKRKKEKKVIKGEEAFAFDNPCLMNINEIDTTVEEIEQPSETKKPKKSKRKSLEKASEFAFENPCLEDVSKIDEEGEKIKKPKRNKVNKENMSLEEVIDNSKNQELEEQSNFAFGNPCLGDVEAIDNEALVKKKRKRSIAEDVEAELSEVTNMPKKAKNNKEVKEEENSSSVTETEGVTGSEFEVPRKHFGVVNTGLDLTDEKPGKRRVTFNDKVEYNTDVEKNKKSKTKLDKFEVENSKKKRKEKNKKGKFMLKKEELKSFFYKNSEINFVGSNVNALRGYKYDR